MSTILNAASALKALSGEGVSFLKRVLGPVAETSDLLSDQIRFYRWQGSVRIIKKAAKIAEENGIRANQIPLKFLIPFLEGSSLEEESSELNDIWAKLLASASCELRTEHYLFADILRRMNKQSAEIFQAIPATEHPELSRWVSVIGDDPRALDDPVFNRIVEELYRCIRKRVPSKAIMERISNRFASARDVLREAQKLRRITMARF